MGQGKLETLLKRSRGGGLTLRGGTREKGSEASQLGEKKGPTEGGRKYFSYVLGERKAGEDKVSKKDKSQYL